MLRLGLRLRLRICPLAQRTDLGWGFMLRALFMYSTVLHVRCNFNPRMCQSANCIRIPAFDTVFSKSTWYSIYAVFILQLKHDNDEIAMFCRFYYRFYIARSQRSPQFLISAFISPLWTANIVQIWIMHCFIGRNFSCSYHIQMAIFVHLLDTTFLSM